MATFAASLLEQHATISAAIDTVFDFRFKLIAKWSLPFQSFPI